MKKKSERLKVVIELYARQEQEALLLLGRSQQKLSEQQLQLEQLLKYQAENRMGLAQQQAAGLSIMQFLEQRAFADKLDAAIVSQKQVVAGYEHDFQRARKNWEESHQRTQSLEKISEQAKLVEAKAAFRIEQTEQDTRAARMNNKDGI